MKQNEKDFLVMRTAIASGKFTLHRISKTKFNSIKMDEITQALFAPSRQGNVLVLKEIFLRKDNLDVYDEKGFTPLIIAAYNNQAEAVKALLDAGVDSNKADHSGNTALMGVCFKGYADIARLLIERGANINAQHGNGGTALMFAAMFGRNGIVDLLIERGADSTLTDLRGFSAADHAAQQGNSAAVAKLQTRQR
jgi:ankyrin repeat protein